MKQPDIPQSSKPAILILGIGNVLLSDEGIGVHAVQMMTGKKFPEHIHLLDGGTGGFHLLSIFQQYKKIIMIDATLDGNKPGTVSLLRPKFAVDFPQTLSSHDIGLKDLVQSSALLGFLPDIALITVSIKDDQPLSMEMSHAVRKSIRKIEKTIDKLLEEF